MSANFNIFKTPKGHDFLCLDMSSNFSFDAGLGDVTLFNAWTLLSHFKD